MGSFYANIAIVGADVDAVARFLDEAGRPAYVGLVDATVIVFDEQGDTQDGSHVSLAADLSGVTERPALAVLNHDDDVLVLHAFEGGELVGERTCGDLFDDIVDDIPEEMRAEYGLDDDAGAESPVLDGAALARLFGGDAVAIDAQLAGDEVFAADLHGRLVELLGLPLATVSTGDTYLVRGERPPGPAVDLRHVAGGTG